MRGMLTGDDGIEPGTQTLQVRAGDNKRGVVMEEVLVVMLGENRYRALSTPGLGTGFARDDVFALDDAGDPQVLQYGGRIGIQAYIRGGRRSADAAQAAIIGLGGSVDGASSEESVEVVTASFPVALGFPAIERCLGEALVDGFSYTNVYADDEGLEPIGWWQ
jgi:hypothetical protein